MIHKADDNESDTTFESKCFSDIYFEKVFKNNYQKQTEAFFVENLSCMIHGGRARAFEKLLRRSVFFRTNANWKFSVKTRGAIET